MNRICIPLLACLLALGCARGAELEAASADPSAAESERLAALFMKRARSAYARADFTRAEQYLSLAKDNGREDTEITPLLIDVCVKDQRYRAALQYSQEHLRRHPRAYRLRFVQASLLMALGEVAQARQELERVLATRPEHADAHYTLAVLLRDDLGNRLEADTHFRDYLRLSPGGVHAEEAGESLLEAVP
ncbi:MAG: tetratricopeptide repeat protein [Myxococcales bacterium]|nr:MAG: tetratricopeptide repeat protein [Myxococcales bacterium]